MTSFSGGQRALPAAGRGLRGTQTALSRCPQGPPKYQPGQPQGLPPTPTHHVEGLPPLCPPSGRSAARPQLALDEPREASRRFPNTEPRRGGHRSSVVKVRVHVPVGGAQASPAVWVPLLQLGKLRPRRDGPAQACRHLTRARTAAPRSGHFGFSSVTLTEQSTDMLKARLYKLRTCAVHTQTKTYKVPAPEKSKHLSVTDPKSSHCPDSHHRGLLACHGHAAGALFRHGTDSWEVHSPRVRAHSALKGHPTPEVTGPGLGVHSPKEMAEHLPRTALAFPPTGREGSRCPTPCPATGDAGGPL